MFRSGLIAPDELVNEEAHLAVRREAITVEIANSLVTRDGGGDLSLGSGPIGSTLSFATNSPLKHRDHSRMSTETSWSTRPWTIHSEEAIRER